MTYNHLRTQNRDFGLSRHSTVGFGIVNNWLCANLPFWDFGHFGRSGRVLTLSGPLLTTLGWFWVVFRTIKIFWKHKIDQIHRKPIEKPWKCWKFVLNPLYRPYKENTHFLQNSNFCQLFPGFWELTDRLFVQNHALWMQIECRYAQSFTGVPHAAPTTPRWLTNLRKSMVY